MFETSEPSVKVGRTGECGSRTAIPQGCQKIGPGWEAALLADSHPGSKTKNDPHPKGMRALPLLDLPCQAPSEIPLIRTTSVHDLLFAIAESFPAGRMSQAAPLLRFRP
jgi:hypothetical protein